jgi:salicylate hydroxylase
MAHNSSTNVLIIGCGVAGPVLAILLKRKGYTPIVFEKVKQLGDAGASLMLMPNGMKVFNLAGVADEIYASSMPLRALYDMTASGQVLGSSHLPGQFQEKYGQTGIGIRRTELNLLLKNKMLVAGIELRE